MSENLPLDNHIKEQLGHYSPDVPSHIWDQIVARREQQRPKGFWFRFLGGKKWLLAVTLLLGLGGTAFWFTQRPDGKMPSSTSGQNANLLLQANSQPLATNQPVAQHGIASNGTNNNSVQSNTTDHVVANTTINSGVNNIPADDNNAVDKAAAAINSVKAPRNVQDGLPLPTGNKTSARHQGKPSNNQTAISAKAKQKTINGKDGVGADMAAVNDKTGHLQLTKPLPDAPEASLVWMPDAATFFKADKLVANELQKRLLYNLLLPDCPTIEDNAAANKKYLELYAGPDFGLRSFGSFSTDSNSNNYLQKRKESAKFSSAFSAGLRYTRVFNNGMSLRSGINYAQINEKFLYINEKDIRYILVITPRQIISGGNTITVYDTLRYTETGKRIKTTYNRYRSIDVPLQLGYEFGNGRLHTNISAGAIINLYSWQKGDVLDSAYQPVSITTGKGSSAYGFKTNIGVGFLGSVSVYYKLTPRLHVLAEPYFRYNLQPMTRDNQNVTQKYSTLGLRFGLRWDFK